MFFKSIQLVNDARDHTGVWHYLCLTGDEACIDGMKTSSNGNIFRVTGHLCGEFTGPRWIPRTQRPVTRSFDVFFYMRPNKRLSKQSGGWWFETPLHPLWRHYNETNLATLKICYWYLSTVTIVNINSKYIPMYLYFTNLGWKLMLHPLTVLRNYKSNL